MQYTFTLFKKIIFFSLLSLMIFTHMGVIGGKKYPSLPTLPQAKETQVKSRLVLLIRKKNHLLVD